MADWTGHDPALVVATLRWLCLLAAYRALGRRRRLLDLARGLEFSLVLRPLSGQAVTLTPQQITERLEAIEQEVQEREVPGERSAEAAARVRRLYERAYAEEFVKATGSPMEKKQIATKMVAQDQELWNELVAAEAGYEGYKAAMRSRELRTSIGQSLLKHQRETGG